MQKSIFKRLLIAIFGVALMVVLAEGDLLTRTANSLNDRLYQRPGASNQQIVLIGMDQRALDQLGPTPWPRSYMAEAIEYLNADPKNRPAVIGIDSTYIGQSDFPEDDARLAEAAAAYHNVVIGETVTFGEQTVVLDDGSFYTDTYVVEQHEQTYAALRAASDPALINAMLDNDGILRHGIWQVELADGSMLPSFHHQIYQKYLAYHGQTMQQIPPLDPYYRWYITFQSAPFAYDENYSLVDLIDGSLSVDRFADKIVLIGPFAQGMQDDYTTAIDYAVKMYGVEYQANAIAALLNGDLKHEILARPQTILLAIISFLAWLWFYERKFITATIFWLSLTIGWLLICYIAFEMGYVLQVFYIPLSITISYLLSVGLNYMQAALDKRRITNTFQRYVAPEIVAELLKGDPTALELGGKLTDIAVLFVDIRGFTPMSESLDAPTVVEIINKYLALTSDCILKNNGTLDKYIGDCTMAFWGAPLAQDDCIYKAVKAGLDMLEGGAKLGAELEAKYGRSINFGVGVHYGPAVVGNIGAAIRMDYTAIGDTVNTAARLESNAPAGQLLISRTVADALDGRVKYTSLGNSIKLKGKADDFEVLRVEGIIE